jgi:DNA-binding MarR family transcriptional regulator
LRNLTLPDRDGFALLLAGMTNKTLRLDDFLPYQLSVTTQVVSALIAGAYETMFGLRIPEWRVIAILADTPSLSQQAIVERSAMDKMTVSRAASALVTRKLAARVPNGADKRSHLLALTPAGERLYAQVAPTALKMEAELLHGFSATDVAALKRMLAKLRDAATGQEIENAR